MKQTADACKELSIASLKCLELNQADREKCAKHFAAYKLCRQNVIAERKKKQGEDNPHRQGKFFPTLW
jgi:hypothetical protein